VELGTRAGTGTLALSHNQTNKVITYDIKDFVKGRISRPNIEFRIENILTSDEKMKILLGAELVFLDVDPHNSVQEQVVSNYLINNNYKGTLLCDDISIPKKYPEMIRWWNSIPITKYDLTEIGYKSHGLGLVDFNNNIEIVK